MTLRAAETHDARHNVEYTHSPPRPFTAGSEMSEKRVGLRWGASGSRISGGSIIGRMQPARTTGRRRQTIRLDVSLLATAGILLVATLLPQLDPDLNIVMKDRTLDVALSALTMVAVAGLAVLSLMRYRETGRLASYVQSSAYVLWAIFSAVTLLLIVFRLDGRVGMTLGEPEQLPAWVAGAVRLSVAGLFMVSGIAAFLGIYGGTRRRVRKIFLPVVVITAARPSSSTPSATCCRRSSSPSACRRWWRTPGSSASSPASLAWPWRPSWPASRHSWRPSCSTA